MKKQLMTLAVCGLAMLFNVGCGSKEAAPQTNDGAENGHRIMYSNLVNTTEQKEVTDLLEGHGIPKEQTDTLIAWANDFNERVTSSALPEGFHAMEKTGPDYGGLIIQNKESEEGVIDPEANCRLTSYLLLKNRIKTNGKHEANDTFLMFDVEAIDTYPLFGLSDEERNDFISFFSWVPVAGTTTQEEHLERIQSAWKERDIQVEGEGISLITVYLHSPFEEVRFVGHTGVLLETEEGLLFLEKYGPQYPFQATKFQDREELKEYLLSRQDLYGDETELPPIILENDRPLL